MKRSILYSPSESNWLGISTKRVQLPNGYSAFTCGYYTEYENGYKLIASGDRLGETPIQEAMILGPNSVPVARDTEDLRDVEF